MSITEGLTDHLLRAIVTRPRTVLGLFLVFAAALSWQARNFQIDASADTLLMRNDPAYILTQVVDHRFSPQEFLLIAYKPKNHPLFTDRTYADLASISQKLRGLKRVESVRSILNVPLFSLAEGGISALKDPAKLTLEHQHYSAAQLKAVFHGHPLYEGLLINKAQTATALQVLFRSDQDLDRIEAQTVALERKSLRTELSAAEKARLAGLKKEAEPIEQRLDRTRTVEIETIRHFLLPYEGEAEIYLGGVHVLGYQLIRIIKNDLIVFGSAIAVAICLILLFLFRRLRWVLIPVVCCLCSVLPTMGLFGLFHLKTTVISSNFIVLQLILTLAIVVHLIVQYREYLSVHPDWDQAELVTQTLRRKAAPCFYASATTAVGFASLLFSHIEPVIAFGWMMIIAMTISTGVSLILCPALMALFGKEEAAKPLPFIRRLLEFFANLSLRHPLLIFGGSLAILAASVGGIFLLKVENSFINYFRAGTRVHRELTFIDREMGGTTPLDLVYTIPRAKREKDLIMTAATVQTLQRIQYALQQHKAVGKILSVVNFTEQARTINHDKPLTEYELTAVYWTMANALRSDLLGSFFSPEHDQVRFSLRIRDTT